MQTLNESIRLNSSRRGFSSAFNLGPTGGSGLGASLVGVFEGSVSWSVVASPLVGFFGGVTGVAPAGGASSWALCAA